MFDWIIRLIDAVGPLGIFFLMLLETIFPPIPSEVIMPLAGMRAAEGQFGLPAVIIAGTLGAMVGNLFWYAAARAIGMGRFRMLINRHGRWLTMDWQDVRRVQRLFGRFGSWLVLLGRMLPTVRSVISIPAGLVHMGFVRFLIWSTVGTAAWSAALAVAGFVLGRNFEKVDEVAGPVSTVIIVAIVLLYVWRQILWSWRRRSA
ncbi:MAG TPA: DedA family protein [Allosphingosinicella sp.]|jgi:membrane protein DedA with SNARE-associated domain